MDYLVTLSFDLNEKDEHKFLDLKNRLSKVGLKDHLIDNQGKASQLPKNTFAAYCNDKKNNPCGYFSEQVSEIFSELNISGYCYINVSYTWNWKVGHINPAKFKSEPKVVAKQSKVA